MSSNEFRPILVIGATGRQGSATVRQLLAQRRPVRAFVRDPAAPAAQRLAAAGAELVIGDLDDPAAVKSALDGAYGVFLMLTMMEGVHITEAGLAAERRRGELVVDLARAAGVEHLVYSSLRGAGLGTKVTYYKVKEHLEAYIADSGVPATVLRPTFFMDNFDTLNRPAVGDDGTLIVNLAVREDIPLSLIAVEDIAAFAAIAFARPVDYLGATVSLAGDRLTAPEIASAFGAVSGRPARSNRLSIEMVRAFDEHVAEMFEAFDTVPDLGIDIDELRRLRPELLDFPGWLARSGWKS
ncbi:NmrA/HSCARG family protein [Nocardia salmonicida]|uniref:NmrA/HSCARG family protein n=1 Tax=Nocardia salmonicida TaxID=53431 RepID=UPI0007A3973E|nr:NmrA/HSCARG family protein [Nocardia salmonicida]